MTSSLLNKILKIDKFCNFSCDIDYNSRTNVFRDAIPHIINQFDSRRVRRAQSVRQPRNASNRRALVLTIKTRLIFICVYIHTSELCLLALRGRRTLCVARGSLQSPGVTLVIYKGDNISKYVCPTVIIYIPRKSTKFINFQNFYE